MAIEIREVNTKRQLRLFFVMARRPPRATPHPCTTLFFDELNTFDDEKNPALQVCEKQLFMAFRDGKAVGRIAAIINRKANEKWQHEHVRFGWMDFIDDLEVSRALLDKVAEWGRERGMKQMNGPVGFTDFDHEGLLIEGYEYLAPMASR